MDTNKQPRHVIFNAKFMKAIKESPENPYDIHIKGLLYDQVKRQRDKLLKALIWADERINKKTPHIRSEQYSEYNLRMFAFMRQTLKNCEND